MPSGMRRLYEPRGTRAKTNAVHFGHSERFCGEGSVVFSNYVAKNYAQRDGMWPREFFSRRSVLSPFFPVAQNFEVFITFQVKNYYT